MSYSFLLTPRHCASSQAKGGTSQCCMRSPPARAEDGWLLSAEASACFRSVATSLPQSGFLDHRARNLLFPFEGHRLAFVVSVLVGLTVRL